MDVGTVSIDDAAPRGELLPAEGYTACGPELLNAGVAVEDVAATGNVVWLLDRQSPTDVPVGMKWLAHVCSVGSCIMICGTGSIYVHVVGSGTIADVDSDGRFVEVFTDCAVMGVNPQS